MSSDRVIPVKVAARVRPFSDREKDENAQECLQYFVERNQLAVSNRFFAFDYVFDPSTSQEAVYDTCAAPLLDSLFKGYNCTVFAYGQTGSGKTFTMGTEETTHSMLNDKRGIIPRMVNSIFSQIEEDSSASSFTVNCSMLEIYEERVHDLLGGATSDGSKEALAIRENKGNVFVQGLSEREVRGLHATIGELERGCQIRSKGETAMNTKSSRSHAVFTLTIRKTATDENGNSYVAKLNLVDLAGSERLKKTQAQGKRMNEGIKINEGLLCLGNVIKALTEGGGPDHHIPYRNSKLTRLLSDSLGGNSHTVMIACVSPADTNQEETLSTLKYAERAKKIKNKPIVNQDPNAAQIQKLRQEVQSLKHELAQYKAGELRAPDEEVAISGADKRELEELRSHNEELQKANDRLQNEWADLHTARTMLITQLAHQEETREQLTQKLDDARHIIDDKVDELSGHTRRGTDASPSTFNEGICLQYLREIRQVLVSPEPEEQAAGDATKDDTDDDTDVPMDTLCLRKLIERQSGASRELEEVVRQIREKEQLLAGAAENHETLREMRKQHESDIHNLQSTIDDLQKERDELGEKLRRIGNASKISEERRKRLQELEQQLAKHQRTMNELKRVEKIKQQQEEAAKKLKDEVQELKRVRVQMVKQLRQEAEKYRKAKAAYEKELNHIKLRERKREFEVAKEKRSFTQQLTVYRRKYEEAVSSNKRLQHQLSRQDVTRSTKFNEHADANKQFKAFLDQELDVVTSAEEAKQHCEDLLTQRTELSSQMRRLKRKLQKLDDEPPTSKRRIGEDGAGQSDESGQEKEILEAEMSSLAKEIELCNTEINALQSKISEYDTDARVEQRWANIHTVASAKVALTVLFEMAATSRRDVLQVEQEMAGMNVKFRQLYAEKNQSDEDNKRAVHALEKRIKRAETELLRVTRQNQLDVASLTKLMCEIRSGNALTDDHYRLLERMGKEMPDADQLEKLYADLESKQKELENVKRSGGGKKRHYFRNVVSSSDMTASMCGADPMPPPQKTRSNRLSRPPRRFNFGKGSELVDEEADVGNESSTPPVVDPDDYDSSYHATPAKKQLQKTLKSSKAASSSSLLGHATTTTTGVRVGNEGGVRSKAIPRSPSPPMRVAKRCKTYSKSPPPIPNENSAGALNETFVKTDSTTSDNSADSGKSPLAFSILGGSAKAKQRFEAKRGGKTFFAPISKRN